jgi:hypothetical protein
LDNWWPYWFINPNSEIGVSGMITYILIIASAFIILGYVVSGIRIATTKLVSRVSA